MSFSHDSPPTSSRDLIAGSTNFSMGPVVKPRGDGEEESQERVDNGLLLKVLVTGVAGFIGFHVAKALLEQGRDVVGVDNLNAYYDVALKQDRLDLLHRFPNFRFHKADISDKDSIANLWDAERDITQVVHLAGQAGVRYSLIDPYAYVQSNLLGFTVILEQCRHQSNFSHLVYASSSSVYGANQVIPFHEGQRIDLPLSFYAATKSANELMAQSCHHLYNLPVTGLRFFTVYGPWGRPDMALFKFTKAILDDQPIDVYNYGNMTRDYTYIDDIVQGVLLALQHRPAQSKHGIHHPIYNLGNHKKETLLSFIAMLENALGKKAIKTMLPPQAGDVLETLSDISLAEKDLGYSPKTSMVDGISRFVDWYRSYYGD
ncbi:MAG: NAD-dependent epimerase/dehydratase family protein [Alphaproteobacteria bacterium]|nr:NAD-dependent epimerase/dehydratase family protein [Alphaproteobacteria bacterium]